MRQLDILLASKSDFDGEILLIDGRGLDILRAVKMVGENHVSPDDVHSQIVKAGQIAVNLNLKVSKAGFEK
jgi:hypothetical protein